MDIPFDWLTENSALIDKAIGNRDKARMQKTTALPQEASTGTAPANIQTWVEEHGDYLFRYAVKHFRDHDVAEELVQETFLAATRAQDQFRGESQARTWLTSILRHKIIDRIRKNKAEKLVSYEETGDEAISHHFDDTEHFTGAFGPREWGGGPEALFAQKQFAGILQSCLGKLPERFKQIFLLREVDGLSREEICNQIGITSTNVGVILHRARISLRDCVQRNWLGT